MVSGAVMENRISTVVSYAITGLPPGSCVGLDGARFKMQSILTEITCSDSIIFANARRYWLAGFDTGTKRSFHEIRERRDSAYHVDCLKSTAASYQSIPSFVALAGCLLLI